jgi:ATP-dependent DNA helicase DinG
MSKLTRDFEEFIKGKHPSIEFRPQQKEAIIDIISAYEEDHNGIYLLDAPTGSGKSVIAMLFADFLAFKGNRGYILASDLSLHEQYVKDFKKLQVWNWGNIKGVDNYRCVVNDEKFSVGECKSKGTSYEKAESLPCFKQCGYLTSRKKAIKSPVSLLTYPYALIQRNYVEQNQQGNGKGSPFPQRDFVVCDEAHKLLDIVQSHFSPIVSHEIVKKTESLIESTGDIGQKIPQVDTERLAKVIDMIYEQEDHGNLLKLLKEVTRLLSIAVQATSSLRENASIEFLEGSIPSEWLAVFGMADWCKDVHCKLEDYCKIIEQVGLEKLVKNPGEKSITFNCIDEYYLLQKHFFTKFGFKLLMTATMGSPSDFMRNHGIKKAKYFKIESHFNWEKSPIIFYPGKKMSTRFLQENLQWAIDSVTRIVRENSEHSGIIHSGSYELNTKIWTGLPKDVKKRIVLYKGSEEKEIALKIMKKKKAMVLMGPSILEGLNMVDDQSRFQIFLKVPYPHLGDKYVAAKLEYSQQWYNWKTSIAVLQGVGRSIRTPEDWAVTHLLDGCFADLMKSAGDQFPPDFKARLRIEYK